jgi:hypothetical protein
MFLQNHPAIRADSRAKILQSRNEEQAGAAIKRLD